MPTEILDKNYRNMNEYFFETSDEENIRCLKGVLELYLEGTDFFFEFIDASIDQFLNRNSI